MFTLGILIVFVTFLYRAFAQNGYISLNARALSDTQVLVTRYDVGNIELATLDFSFRPENESSWQTNRFNPTREYFPLLSLNKSTLYYFRLEGRVRRSYRIHHAYTHIRTPPYANKAPNNVTVVVRYDDSVLVTWSPEMDGRVLGYLVIYTEVDSRDRSLTDYKVKPVFRTYQTVLRDIKMTSRYRVEVASISLDGEGLSRQSVYVGEDQSPYLKISMPPRNLKVKDGGTFILSCKVEGYPTPTIVWRKSGRRFDDRKRRFLEDRLGSMAIMRVDPVVSRQDRGSYTCIASNGFGQRKRARAVVRTYKSKARVPGYPRIWQHPVLKYVEEGTRVIMNCSTSGSPDLTTRWYKNSFPIYESKDNRVAMGADAQLIIDRVKQSDEGTYECSSENDKGLAFSYPAHLYVKERVQKTRAPVFVRTRKRHRVDFGEDVAMTCDAVGEPVPEVWWEFQGQKLKEKSHNGQNIIAVKNMTEQSIYTCFASNKIDTISQNFTIHVRKPKPEDLKAPEFLPANLTVSILYRKRAILVCEAVGVPEPKLVWYQGAVVLKTKSVEGQSTLRLSRLRKSGNYTCTASNPVGEASQVYTVNVSPRKGHRDARPWPGGVKAEAVDSSSVKVEWVLHQDPSARVYYGVDVEYKEKSRNAIQQVQRYSGRGNSMVITELEPATLYEVKVRARAPRGPGVPSDIITVITDPEIPEAPFNVKTTSLSHSNVHIRWDTRTPLERLSAFNVYVLDRATNKETTHRIDSTETSTYNIRALQEDNRYQVTVSSEIKGTEGNRSQLLNFKTKHFVPGPPTAVLGTAINSTALIVKWGIPSDSSERSYILGYRVQYEEMTEAGRYKGRELLTIDEGNSVTLTPLLPNTTYRIQVLAFTEHEDGTWCEPILTKTLLSPIPVDMQPNLISHNSIHLTWEAPIVIRKITAFNIHIHDRESDTEIRRRIPAEKGYTITGLTPDTRYSISVSSVLRPRESDRSKSINVATLPYIPPAPTGVNVESVNETTLLVTWTMIRNDNNYIVRYHTSYGPVGALEMKGKNAKARGTRGRLLLKSLKEDTTYRVRIRAETRTEKGVYSKSFLVTTLASDKPVDLRVSNVGINQADLTWFAPVEKRNITSFRLILTDVMTGKTLRTSLPPVTRHTITDLEPDRKYSLALRSRLASRRGKLSDQFGFRTIRYIPDPPANLLTVPVNDTAVFVEWVSTATEATEKYLIRYHVVYTPVGGGGEEGSIQVSSDVSNIFISSMTPDTRYRVQVRAETMSEQGQYSNPSVVRTFQADKPQDVRVTGSGYDQVTLSWSASIDQRNITAFHLQLRDGETREVTHLTIGPIPTFTFDGLYPDRAYTVSVTSQRGPTRGQTSDIFKFKTLPFIPNSPARVRATALTDTDVLVRWTPDVEANAKQYIVHYRIVYRKLESGQEDGEEQIVLVPGIHNETVLLSLVPETSYTLRVRAETKTEVGAYSRATIVKTYVSDKPHSLRIGKRDFNMAEMSWRAPVDQRNITGFILALKDPETELVRSNLTRTDTRFIWTKLEPDREYSVIVTSLLGNDTGKTSEPLHFRTLPFIPDAPKNLASTPIDDTSVAVQWTPALTRDTQKYVVRYTVSYIKLAGDPDEERQVHVTADTTRVVIKSLNHDSSYRVRVRAETLTEEGQTSRSNVVKTLKSDKPVQVLATTIDFNYAILSWRAPVAQRNITGFKLFVLDEETGLDREEELSSSTSTRLSQLEPDRNYNITVTSMFGNSEGKTSDVLTIKTLPYIPDAPLDVVTKPLDDTTILVKWTPNVNDDTRRYIVQYDVEVGAERGEKQIIQVSGDQVHVIVMSLQADTSYNVRVRAGTLTEKGVYSGSNTVKTLKSDKPYRLAATKIGFNYAVLSWRAPVAQRNITGFKLSVIDEDTGLKRSEMLPSVLSTTLSQLEPDRNYNLAVTSMFGDGKGKTSDVLRMKTLPYIPGSPLDVVIKALDDTTILVKWTPNVDDDTRRYIVQYDVAVSLERAPRKEQIVEVAGDQIHIVVDSLQADTSYSVRVRARTQTEDGQYSEPKPVRTLKSDQPVSLQTTSVSFNWADISWVAPVEQRNITGFKMRITDTVDGQERQEDLSNSLTHKVPRLEPDRDYTLTVTAMFGIREGKVSEDFEFRTAPFIPQAPLGLKTSPLNDTAVLVEWTPNLADDTEKYVVSYNILYIQVDNSQETGEGGNLRVSGDARRAVVQPLSADTGYSFLVRADTRTEKGDYTQPANTRTLRSDKPQEISTTRIDFSEVDVSWQAPVEQRNITGFALTLTDLSTSEERKMRIPPQSSYTITKLEPDRTYNLFVTSMFGNKEGKTSELLEFRTNPFIPEAPTNIRTTPLNDMSALVQWTPTLTDDTRKYVVRYNIAYRLQGGRLVSEEKQVQVPGDVHKVVLKSLDADTSYQVLIRAETPTQQGQYSKPSVFKTLRSDKPGLLRADMIDFNRVQVSWNAPIEQRSITGFMLILTDLETGEVTERPSSLKGNELITGLEPDRSYTLRVTSLFADQEGKTSDALEFETLPYIPAAPTQFVISPLNDTAVAVEWTPTVTDDTRRYIVRYNILFEHMSSGQENSVAVAGDVDKAVIRHLEADTEYRVRVRAVTQTEHGKLTVPKVTKTLKSDKPRSLRSREVDFNFALISWWAPVDQREITAFKLTLTDLETGEITDIKVDASSRYKVDGLEPDRDYNIVITSLFGESNGKTSDVLEFRTKPFIPQAPSDLRTKSLNDTGIMAEWQPTITDDTRRYLARYRIFYRKTDNAKDQEKSVTVPAETTSIVIGALTADTTYAVRVRAETQTQNGLLTQPKNIRTLVSDKPTSLRVSGVIYKSVDLSWYAPVDERSILGFEYQLTDVKSGEITQGEFPPATRQTLENLKPDTEYSFIVKPQLEIYEGKVSDALTFRTIPYIPDAPSEVTGTAVNDTSLSIQWTPNVDPEVEQYISHYHVTYTNVKTWSPEILQVDPASRSAWIHSLDADTTYKVQVRAETFTEQGKDSEAITITTLESDKPRALKTGRIVFNEADLTWYAPVKQRDILNFKLTVTDVSSSEVKELIIPPRTSYTLAGLIAERQYSLTVTSQLQVGVGKTSDTIQFTTSPFAPPAPDNVKAIAMNDTAILVEWTPTVTEETRRYVNRYHVAYNELKSSQRVKDRESVQVNGDSNMAVITSLDPDVSYRVRVRAETPTKKGTLSKAVVVRTLQSDKPRALRATDIQFDRISASWYAPTEQRNITQFELMVLDVVSGNIIQLMIPPETQQVVQNLRADTDYVLTVTSILGDATGKTSAPMEFKTKPFIPALVEDVALTPLNQTTIQVEWIMPEDAGSKDYITSYRLEYGKMDQWRRVRDAEEVQYRGGDGLTYISGLDEDTEYRFRVRAETDTEVGAYTKGDTSRTLISEEPRNMKKTGTTDRTISISWTSPIEQRNITNFKVYVRDAVDGEKTEHEIPAQLSYTAEQLKPDRHYEITVAPVLDNREGISSSIKIKTDPYIPVAPSDVAAVATNATAVSVKWVSPDDSFARQYVAGFDVLYTRADSKLPTEDWASLEFDTKEETALISFLEPDTEYNVCVRVKTATEKGNLSKSVLVRTLVSAIPTNLQITRLTFEEFDLTWVAPVDERNISGFAVYLTDLESNTRTRSLAPPDLEYTFKDLSPSSEYLAEVASMLEVGEGILSDEIHVETEPFVAEPPVNIQFQSFNFSTVSFRWELPTDVASKKYITGSHILLTRLGGVDTYQHVILGQGQEQTLSFLKEDLTYEVQIRAFSDTAIGKLSEIVYVTTPPRVPDWSPDLLTATVEYDTSVRLEWYVRSPKAELDKTLQYEVEYFRHPDPYGSMFINGLLSGPTIIDNLESHSTYSFRIRAYSSSGPGPWSHGLDATFGGPDVGSVAIIRINRTDSNTSRTRWVLKSRGDMPIRGYRVYYTPIDWKFESMAGQRFLNSVGTTNRIDINKNLLKDQYYHVQVAAFSDEGIGRRSKPVFLPDMDYPRIAIGPRDFKCAAKLSATFSCQISGVPDYKVVWKKGPVRLTPRLDERITIQMVNNTSVLRIKTTKPEDSGVYTCVLNVNRTLYTRDARLDVYAQTAIPSGYPSFTRNPTLTSVETGSNTSFICEAAGIPTPEIQWHKNNVPIKESKKFVMTQIVTVSGPLNRREGRLWVLNATKEDMGKYVCSAENKFGIIYNFDAQLYVKVKQIPPEFVNIPEDAFVKPGGLVNLTCEAEGVPDPIIRWLVDGAYVEETNHSIGKGHLLLPKVYRTAQYTCEASNAKGEVSTEARVEVDTRVDFEGVVLEPPTDKIVSVGSSVLFMCRGTGSPRPRIYWERDGKVLSEENMDKAYAVEERRGWSVLEIQNIRRHRDQGVFSCVVENDLGYEKKSATLTVYTRNEIPEDMPQITKWPETNTVFKGDKITLSCSTNQVDAQVTWYKNRFKVFPSRREIVITADGTSQLMLLRARDSDYGRYQCAAQNEQGVAYSRTARVYIRKST